MKSFWECERLFFEDLPTVRDLIWNADWDILAREVARYYASDEIDFDSGVIRPALEEMMSLEIREPSAKWLFLPFEYYSIPFDSEMIECQIDAALMRRRDFATIEELSAHEELLFSARDCRESLKREADRYGNNYPSLHGWSMFSWEKTLSFRVWMQGEYSRKERYQVLGSIVREMMFFGETEAEARRERRRVKKRLKRDSKLFDEEAVKTNPIELLFRNYGLESSTDDYQSEYVYRQNERAMVLNHNATTDLHRRIADLSRRIERAEKKNFRSEVSFDQW